MCGICGVVGLEDERPVEPNSLAAMCDTLVHRGPDAAGAIIMGPAGLAMRRLSIIDVEGGQQPLANEDGSVHVVCNGEIYNYRELRAELQAQGHQFRTASDCEVIVHAYEAYGDAFVARLNGMFGLALWDSRRRRLLLARDRVGIKPLYYARHDGRLLFGSEPKALLAYPGFPRSLDPAALYQYLTYEYVPTPRSIFAGVRKLRPGHALVAERGGLVEWAYWEPDLSPAVRIGAPGAGERRAARRVSEWRHRFERGCGGDDRAQPGRGPQLLDRVRGSLVRRVRVRAAGGDPPRHHAFGADPGTAHAVGAGAAHRQLPRRATR
jgi:asparagine synthase (glutamine-hydrolysing)